MLIPPSLIFNHIYLLFDLVLKWNIYKAIPKELTMRKDLSDICLYHMRKEASKHCELVCAIEVVGNSPSKLLKMSLCFSLFLPCVFLSIRSRKNSC